MKTIRIACDTKDKLPLSDLTPFQGKLKKLSKSNYEKLKNEILTTGFAFPIYVWKGVKGAMYIIGGHQRVACLWKMAEEGYAIPAVPIVYIEASSINEAKRRVLQDVSQYGDVDKQGLYEFMIEAEISMDLLSASFQIPEAELNMKSFRDEFFGDEYATKNSKDDDIPSVPKKPKTKIGDVYILGKNRLVCGNSGDIDAIEKLTNGRKSDMVFTDPPYGISYQSNTRVKSKKFDVIENDNVFLTDWINHIPGISNGFVFVWTTWKVIAKWIELTAPIGEISNLIIWDKGGGGIGDLKKTFATDYEIAIVFHRGAIITGKRLGSVWSVGKDGASRYLHPTQKPVALAEMAIETCTNEGDSVLDVFGGSGSTLIACEKLKRNCLMMELDPRYCDVIVNRWEIFTGRKATLEKPPVVKKRVGAS